MIIDIIGYFFAFVFLSKMLAKTAVAYLTLFIISYKYHGEMFFYEFFCVYYNKYLYLH